MKSEKITKVLYYEGEFDQHIGKYLNSLVRYVPSQIVGVLSLNPSPSLERFLEEKNIHLFTNVEDLTEFNQFVITQLSFNAQNLEQSRNLIRQILDKGVTVVNGSHTFLSPEFIGYENKIIDLRRDTSKQRLFQGKIIGNKEQKRILTIGMDCNIGKMTTSLELYKCMNERGYDVEFIATGQIGISICGKGIPLDRSIVDFTSGFMEEHLLEYRHEYLLIEGQGSLFTPLYSGLALAQVHGCVPDSMILCADPTRKNPRYFPEIKLPPIKKAIESYEDAAKLVNPKARVIGISVNTSSLDETSSVGYLNSLRTELNLPVFDPIRTNISDLSLEELLNAHCNANIHRL